jgi:hypothetical protein
MMTDPLPLLPLAELACLFAAFVLMIAGADAMS